MSQSNLLNCVDIQVYKDPKFKSTLETAILSSPQTITLPNDEKFKNVTDDLNSLIDGNCVIVSMPGIGILYGQLIIEDSKYKIRYLNSPTDNIIADIFIFINFCTLINYIRSYISYFFHIIFAIYIIIIIFIFLFIAICIYNSYP